MQTCRRFDSELPSAVGAILNQHAWNLFWFGSVTAVVLFLFGGLHRLP